MGIIATLKEKGITVSKTDQFFRGIYKTPEGTGVSRYEDKCDKGIYFLQIRDGKILPCNGQTVCLVSGTEYEGKLRSAKEAEELAAQGKIFSFASSDVYAEYYGFADDPDLESCFWYGYSAKSREYIEQVMKEIGLSRYTDVSNSSHWTAGEGVPFALEPVCTYDIFLNCKTEIVKVGDEWVAQTCIPFAADDFGMVKMYFGHMPSEEEVRMAFAVRQFHSHPIELFTCRECGSLNHWLSLPGDIEHKYEIAQDRYCGC